MGRASALLIAIVALAAAGCGGGGGDGSDSERVTQAVTDYAHAFGSGKGKEACALLTPGARDAFTTRVSSIVGTRDCVEAMTKLGSVAGPNVTGPFQDAKVSDVKVAGARATAKLTAGGHAAGVTLEKRDGDWLLTRAPGT